LKWLFEAFKDDPEVGIVLKTNAGRNTKIDRDLVLKTLNSVIAEVRKGPYPKLHFLHGEMSDTEISGLYRNPQIKALVSLTRGEGFGLPVLEAAAAGLPVIATSWSAHTEFLKNVKFIGVDYKLTQVHPSRIDGKIFVQGSNWADPIESDFKKKVLKFKSSSSQPTLWAQEGSKIIQEKYSFASIAKQYDDILRPYFV
jgi:glycosyltransferase involved in cell wall biosynthesis